MKKIVALSIMYTLVGCNSTVYKDTPETLTKLENCEKGAAEKDKLIKDYEGEIARLQREGTGNNEIVVRFEGDILNISTGRPGAGQPPIDEKLSAKLSRDFIDVVQKSRGAIQKCYEQALKKNSNLQAKTISMTVSATFAATGDYQRSAFSPSLGDGFDACMKNIAQKWKLSPAPASLSFQAPVSLTPS